MSEKAPIIDFAQAKIDEMARLAQRIGRGFPTWEKAFEGEDIARKAGIGETSIVAFRDFRNVLANNPNKTKEMHQIELKWHGKRHYSYRVYLIDGIPFSSPDPLVNAQLEWLFKGTSYRATIDSPNRTKDQTIAYFEEEVEFLKENYGLRIELKRDSNNRNHIWLAMAGLNIK